MFNHQLAGTAVPAMEHELSKYSKRTIPTLKKSQFKFKHSQGLKQEQWMYKAASFPMGKQMNGDFKGIPELSMPVDLQALCAVPKVTSRTSTLWVSTAVENV